MSLLAACAQNMRVHPGASIAQMPGGLRAMGRVCPIEKAVVMDERAIEVLESFPKRSFPKGDFIIRQGDAATCVYYLARGTSVRNSYSLRGDEITYGERRADRSASCLLGALTFYTDERVHETNFVAKTACTCYIIPQEPFKRFLDDNPAVLHELVRLALHSYTELNANFHAKLKGLAPARIASYLLNHTVETASGPVLNERLNLSGLGRELGMHRITVGKIIHAFTEEGLVVYRGNVLAIIDPVRLAAYADGELKLDYQGS